MSGIKQPIKDVLAKLALLTVTNGDGSTVNPYVRVWNNQVAYFKEGKMEAWPMPAFFVEVVNSPVYENIGQYFRAADLSFRVHIVHWFTDAQDFTFEQDLLIFDLRDKVVSNLTAFTPTACGPLNCMSEMQDFTHDNVYELTLDFVCNFTDSIGSKYDVNHPLAYLYSTPPTNVEIDLTKGNTTTVYNYTVTAQSTIISTQYTSISGGEYSFTVLDSNGNLIIGATIVSVTKGITLLTQGQFLFSQSTSVLTLLNGLKMTAAEIVTITYQKNN